MSGFTLDQFQEARERLLVLSQQEQGNRNEATTRLHFIDSLLVEVLGWSRSDIIAEDAKEREYADYVLLAPRAIAVWEAKREGIYFTLPAGISGLNQPLKHLRSLDSKISSAIEQVAGYCFQRGTPIAVVCNGHQLIAFQVLRGDGVPPYEGRALVFTSLQSMVEHFDTLWDCLSKPGIEEKKLLTYLAGDVKSRPPSKLPESIVGFPRQQTRNELQADLQLLGDLVIEDIAKQRDLEPRFLDECYAESGALSQYSTLSRQILATRYAALFDSEQPGPTLTPATTKRGVHPDLLASSLSRRPILLLGDVGVGKSAFVRNLIVREAPEELARAITIHIDLGFKGNLMSYTKTVILDEIDRQLREEYGFDSIDRNIVRGIYRSDIQRFEKSLFGDLKEFIPQEYKKREIEFMEELIGQRGEHLRRCIEHISKARKQQVVIFIDNADQRDDETQQQAFLAAQEIAQDWLATVFVAIRPGTYHLSSNRGALSGYHTRAFTISPPRTEIVIQKRIQFALKITSGEISLGTADVNIEMKVQTLDRILRILSVSLERSPGLYQVIENISAGNTRRALDLIHSFLGSGHIDTEKMLKKYEETGSYYVAQHEFLRAVIYGDYRDFDPNRSYVANLFDVTTSDGREHFLQSLLLSRLSILGTSHGKDGFVETALIYRDLQSLGFSPDQVDGAVVRGTRTRLVESLGRRIPDIDQQMPLMLRITPSGMYHVRELCKRFVYLDAVVADTPILDVVVRRDVHDAFHVSDRLDRAQLFLDYLHSQWRDLEPTTGAFDWPSVYAAAKQDMQYARAASRAALEKLRRLRANTD